MAEMDLRHFSKRVVTGFFPLLIFYNLPQLR